MATRSRNLTWMLAVIGAFALASFILAGVSLWVSVTSRAASNRQVSLPAAALASWRWSEIESADGATYAANLRAMGCPEATINTLLKAHVSESAPSSSELVELGSANPGIKRAVGPAVGSSSVISPLSPVIPVPELPPSAPAEVASVSPPPPVPVQTVAIGGTGSAPRVRNVSSYYARHAVAVPPQGAAFVPQIVSDPVSMVASGGQVNGSEASNSDQAIMAPSADAVIPAAFQNSASSSKLSEADQNQIEALQRNFVHDIGTPAPSTPGSPAPAGNPPATADPVARWTTAQEESDERYQALFGTQAFNDMEVQQNLNGSSGASGQ